MVRTVFIPYDNSWTPEEIIRNFGEQNPDLYYILMGLSKNDNSHVVVCRNTGIIHDPSHDEMGIAGLWYKDKYYVVLLAPSRQFGMV